ncbi:energy transducer TonB [Lutibacter sp. TH_r2]|uniref:energy transducer TonB n=1 Tax=Lutibacter sp. TH_r2 TaxID=3082083 RepID=UPI0029549AF0|nr:energy transducer TonB [Lutibacter sp. TH_r2]MDV7186230.1 energy transducer TonB [Lutibacter sp. TH_r2]
MQNKKHPRANLDNYSKLFVQLGLVLSLAIAYFLLESKTFDKQVVAFNDSGLTAEIDNTELIEYKIEPPKPKPIIQNPNINKIDKKDNDDENFTETAIEVIDPDTPVDPVIEFKTVEKPIDFNPDDEVPFDIIEDVPVFPGCVGNNEELKACFSKKISKFINSNFNIELASELGLHSGKQKIYTIFKIDKNGNVVDIQAKAPHKKLQKEAVRVIEQLPKMQPGMQRKVPVAVKYSIPITFSIE